MSGRTTTPDGALQGLWDQRTCRFTSPGQLLIELPVIGWLTEPRFGYLVGELLDARWSNGELAGVEVLSVAGHCSPSQGRRMLVLLIAYRPAGAPRRIDNAQMRRHVARAIAEAHLEGRRADAHQGRLSTGERRMR